ncbi:MAG: GspE/PulE family protein [Desulfobacterales bacterium]|jgi:general secretion pathway protein E
MPNNNNNLLSDQNICQVLLNKSLIESVQAKEILRKKESLKSRLEKQRNRKNASGNRNIRSVNIIDIIASLNLRSSGPDARVIDEELIFQVLAEEWKIPFQKIDPLKLDLNLVTTTIPRSFAMKHLVLPIGIKDGYLTVATPDPFNVEVIEDIARASQLKVKVVVSTKSDIVKLINEFFGFKRSIAAAEHQFAGPSVDLGNLEQYVRLKPSDELPSTDQHVVNAVNHLFTYAFDQRASDIHIEPKRDVSLIRMRIDGVLHTVYQLPKNVHSAIISRIKNLSRLDMAEKRKPQDGRIKTDKEGVEVEIRVSTIPVAFGEKVVMRVMDPNILFQDLEKLGFTSTDLIRYNKFINMPHGIVLVCGPTGSGKSTTLYSTLRDLYTPEINITTIEDPIEMIHESFNQIAVQPVIGVTFANILRNILRQDPDIIMIGEMRDLETAENAVQAALTGHLVLSTLHTNDAPSSITRLLDLGVPSFLIQSTLVGIMAQRLVRKICNHCMESFEMETAELKAMGLDVKQNGRIKLKRGRGCQRCRGTGYYGRTGIFEVIPYSESLKKMTTANADFKAIAAQAKEEGMITLRENALIKLLAGETTYQEVLRVTWEQS